MKAEPKQRRDGRCAYRQCSETLPDAVRATDDPFHSTICCRAYYGVVFSSDEASEKYSASRRPQRASAAA